MTPGTRWTFSTLSPGRIAEGLDPGPHQVVTYSFSTLSPGRIAEGQLPAGAGSLAALSVPSLRVV